MGNKTERSRHCIWLGQGLGLGHDALMGQGCCGEAGGWCRNDDAYARYLPLATAIIMSS